MKTITFPFRGLSIILTLFFACSFIATANIRNPLPDMHVDNIRNPLPDMHMQNIKNDVTPLNLANIRNPLPDMHFDNIRNPLPDMHVNTSVA